MSVVKSEVKHGWKVIDIAITIVGVSMAGYHLLSTQHLICGGFQHQNVHLGFALALLFLGAIKKSEGIRKYLMFALLVLSIACISYVGLNLVPLQHRAGFNTILDYVIGIMIVILVLEATRQSFGYILPLLAILFIGYAFLGNYLPQPLKAANIPIDRLLSCLSIGLSGVYGELLAISANYIFLFVLFGAILQTSGATVFFEQVGRLVGNKVSSGAVLSSVVTSALVGMITGSVGANVATTGSFTIPAMKKAGLKPEYAGAIEAAASSGGQIMPPVMGAAAFAMAGVTGVPYLRIMIAAILPALLYFFTIGIYVQIRSSQSKLITKSVAIDYKEMLLRMPLFIVPISTIMWLLFVGNSLMYSAFWGIISTILLSLLRKETRSSLLIWMKEVTAGSVAGSEIATAISCTGIVLTVITLTGVGIKLPGLVEALSGGNIVVALVIVAIVSLILGTGISTLAVYLIVVIVAAPIMLNMGISLLPAHFFVFFYGCFSMVTPPIGMASIIAAKLAGAKYIPTAIEGVKASLGGFLIPFLIILNPVLLFEPIDSLFLAIIEVIACFLFFIVIEVLINNYYITKVSFWEILLLIISSITFVGFFFSKNFLYFTIGLILLVIVTTIQIRIKERISTYKTNTVDK